MEAEVLTLGDSFNRLDAGGVPISLLSSSIVCIILGVIITLDELQNIYY